MRHRLERGHLDAPTDIFAQTHRHFRIGIVELFRFQNLSQADQFAPRIGNLDTDSRLAGNALDQNRFGLQTQAQVFGEGYDATVLDARFRLELEGRDHRAGVDLYHRAMHIELFELGFDSSRDFLQFEGVVSIAAWNFVEQIGGRQPVFRMLGHFRCKRLSLA